MEATKEKHATHTPGPWYARGKKVSIFKPFATAYQAIATVEQEKDARLIAAAPDLLSQCRELEKIIRCRLPELDADIELAKLREVLAKVDGGEG